MKKILLMGILVVVICFILNGCGNNISTKEQENNTKENNSVNSDEFNSKMSNSIMNIDGIYLNNEYTDEDELKQIVLFFTIKSDDENLDICSTKFRLKINKNEYSPVADIETPNLTQYYYSSIIEKVYVGKSLKVAAIFKVPEGDLVSGKKITLENFDNYAKDIIMKTDDIKRMDNLTDISIDIDKEYATKRQEEENEKLVDADDETAKRVKNDLNGYYFDIPAFVGNTYVTYRLEFIAPNNFEITSRISGASLNNNGTYKVTNGYIVLHYDTNGKDVNVPYRYENGEITIDSPFYSNGSDTIF